ncbi:hypothetical protein F4810DRAFT_643943 [Camillea tinctor]|nr:hypothetical protein F4810DRAFT_643943 [Camillea tinctor]
MSLDRYETLSNQPSLLAFRPERRLGQQQQQSSQAWTAARCHRLLRPLVSRIAALRKETIVSVSTSISSVNSAAQPVARHEATGKTRSEESEWLMPRKKRARLTYSQRRPSPHQPVGSSGDGDASSSTEQGAEGRGLKRTVKCQRRQEEQQRRRASHGEFVPATPLLRRARGHMLSSPISTLAVPRRLYNNDDNDGFKATRRVNPPKRKLDERVLKLRARMAPERHGDLEAIFRSLEALLKATAHPSNPRRPREKGPRSFLAMCLRKVPEYITEVEAWERWDAEQSGTTSMIDNIDASAQIYNELESLGASKGWKHLRVVVRADGLKAVREGISEWLFGDEFSEILIDLCKQANALSEAQELMQAWVERQYPHPISADSSFSQMPALQPLLSLVLLANSTQCTPFLFRQYSALLSSNNLPQDWLATREFERVWEMAAQALCSTRANIDAATLAVEAISLLCRRKRTLAGNAETIQSENDMLEATQRTLTSILTTVATMSRIGENEIKSHSTAHTNLQRLSQIGDRLRYILKACIARIESSTRRRANTRIDMVYLALLLSSDESQGAYVEAHVRESITNSWKQQAAPKHSRNYDSLALLISSVARGCSRGTSIAPHQCLEGLFQRLAVLDIDSQIADRLKGAAAFLLAQQTNNVRDLIYAEKLNAPPENGGEESRGATLFTGYRWEETIGEWVAASPVASKKQGGTTTRRALRSSSMAKKSVVGDRPASDAETTALLPPRRSKSLTRRDAGSVADPETSQGGDVGPPRLGYPTRKRPFRGSYSTSFSSSYRDLDDDDGENDESATAAATTTTPDPKPKQVLPRKTQHRGYDDELATHEHEDEDEDDKENRPATRTTLSSMKNKQAQRMPGKLITLLGSAKSRREIRGWGLYSSDDELCT